MKALASFAALALDTVLIFHIIDLGPTAKAEQAGA
jgi:hypothetical protein